MRRTFSRKEQSFSGTRTIVLRPEDGSIGVALYLRPAGAPGVQHRRDSSVQ
jgi:hypothetical protein